MQSRSVATGSALLFLVAVVSLIASAGKAQPAQEESTPGKVPQREAQLNWVWVRNEALPRVGVSSTVPLAEETEELAALKKRSKFFLRLLFGESVLPKGAEEQLLAVSSDADRMCLPAFEYKGLDVVYVEGYAAGVDVAVVPKARKADDGLEPGAAALAMARTLFVQPGSSIRDLHLVSDPSQRDGRIDVLPVWSSPEEWHERTGLHQWWPEYLRFYVWGTARINFELHKQDSSDPKPDDTRHWFSLPLAPDSGGIQRRRTESRASLIARFDLAQLPWQPDPTLDQVEFFDTPEAKAALTDGTIRGPEDLDQAMGERVELTPGVQRAVQDAAILISVVLAPEALPRGFAERLVPLHTETRDRVELPRYEHQGWVVSINVTQGAVNVLAKRRDGKRVTGPEEFQKMVSDLANKLFLSTQTVTLSLELPPVPKRQPYGLSGFVILKPKRLDISQIWIVNQPSRLALLASWPMTLRVETDGLTTRFICGRPSDDPSPPAAGEKRPNYPSNQWFERMSSSRHGPTWGRLN